MPYAERTNFHNPVQGTLLGDCCTRRTGLVDADHGEEREHSKTEGRRQIALQAVGFSPTFNLIGMLHRAVCTGHDLFLEPAEALTLQTV